MKFFFFSFRVSRKIDNFIPSYEYIDLIMFYKWIKKTKIRFRNGRNKTPR